MAGAAYFGGDVFAFRLDHRAVCDRLTAPDPLLARRGFVLRQRHLFEWGLLHADLWDLQPPDVIVSPEIGNDNVGFKV
jgi:hypothetical protein